MALKPPKNLIKTTPRCCVTCKHYTSEYRGKLGEENFDCERGGACSGDVEDYSQVCDYYKAQ